MEDFKIVLYVLAAFAWMIFKNYEKIKKDTASRDLSKPAEVQKTEATINPPALPKDWAFPFLEKFRWIKASATTPTKGGPS